MLILLIINYFRFPQISFAFRLNIKDLNYDDYMQIIKLTLIAKLTVFNSQKKGSVFMLKPYTVCPKIQVTGYLNVHHNR
jgi:hypothetical protein